MNVNNTTAENSAERNTENNPAQAVREPCRADINTYLSFLCSGQDDKIVTLCFMDAHTDKPVRGYSCVHCRMCEAVGAWEEVARVSPGCTMHTTLCETNMQGRRTEHIQSVRVICVDIDKKAENGGSGGSLELGDLGTNAALAAPDLVVESSPGKFHLYWRVSEAIPVERWRRYQVGFAHRFGGDKSLSNAVSLIRVPGFWRVCKDGTVWCPRVVSLKSDALLQGDGPAGIVEPQLIKVFGWLQAAIAEGEAALKEERRVAGEWARKLWKERRKVGSLGADSARIDIDLGAAPELGRNVTLYMTMRELMRERTVEREEVTEDQALDLARELNARFHRPLDVLELRKTAISAWRHGVESGEAWLEKTDYLGELQQEAGKVALAEPDKTEEPSKAPQTTDIRNELPTELTIDQAVVAISRTIDPKPSIAVIKSNGHDKSSAGRLLELKVLQAEGPNLDNIPTSFEAVGDQLVSLCWDTDKRDAAKALASALGTRNYGLYATWLCGKFLQIGVFRKNGVGVFVRGRSRWGSDVFYCAGMGKEEFVSLMSRVVTKIARKCVKHKLCKQWVKRMPGQTCVRGIGDACWGLAILAEKQERQSPDVIVFQNGVFNLVSGEFILDSRAPVRHSHAVWCRFDLGVARKWLDSERKRCAVSAVTAVSEHKAAVDIVSAPLTVSIGRDWSLMPELGRFLDYMNQWFPGDRTVIEVVMRWFGYGMTTDTGRNKFAFFYGPTRAGKGSICRTFCGIVGDVNYSVSDYEALGGGFKAANFMDKLLICIEEVEGTVQEHKNRMGYLKKLLGGEKVCVERKYEQPYEDRLIGKFVLQSNEAPVYQDKGHALRARMLAMGFERSFEDKGASVDPADEILGAGIASGECAAGHGAAADAIGTVAALSWWAGRGDRSKGFELDDCRALIVGKEEIVAGLDIFEMIGLRYCKADRDGGVESAVCSELIDLVVEAKGIKSAFQAGKKEGMFKAAVEKLYPQVRHTTNLPSEGGKRIRGYDGLVLNGENVVLDFEETLNSSPGRFGRLKQLLSIDTAKDQLFDF